MSKLTWLQPAPFIKPIEDKETIDKDYNYWRLRILYSTFIGYAFYYFTRKSFTFALPSIAYELHLDKGQLGLLASIFSVTYGVSKFASGLLSDVSNPRYFMAIGLMVTGLLNILFGMSSSMLFFALFWGLNGWFQGFGWPPCAKFLTHWYARSERGSWWSTWNVSHNVGAFLIPWITGFALRFGSWRLAMYIPGILCLLCGFFLINRLRDTPQSLGLPSVEKWKGEVEDEEDSTKDSLSTKEIFFTHVFFNPCIWLLAVSYFFVYFVRTGINDWTSFFLIEEKSYSQLGANGCVSFFEFGGFFGSLFAGWVSDYLFQAKRGPVNAIFAATMLISVLVFWMLPQGHHIFDSLAMFGIGFAIFGPQMLIGVAAAELSHKKAAATSTGFVGCFAYMGAAFAGYPLGRITESFGWTGFFFSLACCAALSLFFLIPLWNATPQSKIVLEGDLEEEPEYV